MRKRILLADDHRVLLDALKTTLEQQSDLAVVGLAENGRRAMELVDELVPDVVVIDVGMPELNGVDATRQITKRHPRTRVVALSTFRDGKHVMSMLKAGASAYVLKSEASSELLAAIRKVCEGERFLSSGVTDQVVNGAISPEDADAESGNLAKLGEREREVLQLVAEGLTSGEIASKLFISPSTVDTHRRNIMRKLELHGIADLTRFAVREGLAQAES